MGDWWDRRLFVLDLETTGVDARADRIVTVAFGHVGGGQPSSVVEMVVVPDGFTIPAEAEAVHGFSTERALEEGAPLVDVLEQVKRTFDDRRADEVLVVFNARFDVSLLTAEFQRTGVETPDVTSRIVDPLLLDRWLDRFRKGKRTLESMCAHYSVRLEGAHSGRHDAIAAARLAWVLGKRGEIIRSVRDERDGRELAGLKRQWEWVRRDPVRLHELQIVLAAEQAEGLERYFRAGDPARGIAPQPDAVVERTWPLLPALVGVAGG